MNTLPIFVAIDVSGTLGLLAIDIIFISTIISTASVSFLQLFSQFTGKEQLGNNYFFKNSSFPFVLI